MCYDKQAQGEKKRNFKTCGKSNKVLNVSIEKQFKKIVKKKKGRKKEKEMKHFQEMWISDDLPNTFHQPRKKILA